MRFCSANFVPVLCSAREDSSRHRLAIYGAGRAMTREGLPAPWPMLLIAVFDDDQEEEAARLLHWLGGQPTVA